MASTRLCLFVALAILACNFQASCGAVSKGAPKKSTTTAISQRLDDSFWDISNLKTQCDFSEDPSLATQKHPMTPASSFLQPPVPFPTSPASSEPQALKTATEKIPFGPKLEKVQEEITSSVDEEELKVVEEDVIYEDVDDVKSKDDKADDVKVDELKADDVKVDAIKADDVEVGEVKSDDGKVDDVIADDVKVDDFKRNDVKVDAVKNVKQEKIKVSHLTTRTNAKNYNVSTTVKRASSNSTAPDDCKRSVEAQESEEAGMKDADKKSPQKKKTTRMTKAPPTSKSNKSEEYFNETIGMGDFCPLRVEKNIKKEKKQILNVTSSASIKMASEHKDKKDEKKTKGTDEVIADIINEDMSTNDVKPKKNIAKELVKPTAAASKKKKVDEN